MKLRWWIGLWFGKTEFPCLVNTDRPEDGIVCLFSTLYDLIVRPSVGLLSCRSEPDEVAARELFEGALEALTRTKDSIGRATRQAMECAKFGITNEVVCFCLLCC
jgi:hypothetical protein